jgi:hypothetical protein
VLDAERINGARYTNHHSLKLRLDRRISFSGSNLIVYLGVWNAYNRKTLPDTAGTGYRRAQGQRSVEHGADLRAGVRVLGGGETDLLMDGAAHGSGVRPLSGSTSLQQAGSA